MWRNSAPFYLRRTKEALVIFPDQETGEVRKLFTKREVHATAFSLDGDELDIYEALTHYVEDQSIEAADDSARGRAVGFTMALLQRRMASSVYAVRRTLERMKAQREKILADPVAYRQSQIERPHRGGAARGRGVVHRRRRPVAQRLMRALLIVEGPIPAQTLAGLAR